MIATEPTLDLPIIKWPGRDSSRRICRAALLVMALLLLCGASSQARAAQPTRDKLVAVYLYRLAEHLQWPNQAEIERYHIHLIDNRSKVYEQLRGISQVKTLHGKPFEVTRTSKAKIPANVHMLFVAKAQADNYPDIYAQAEGHNILLVSDNVDNKRIIMINLYDTGDKQISFEINKANIINQNLGVNPDIILLGGTEIDVAKLYREAQVSLRSLEQQLAELEQKRRTLETTIKEVRSESSKLEAELERQKQQLSEQLRRLKTQEQLIRDKEQAVVAQQERLKKAVARTEEQQRIIQAQERQVAIEHANYVELARQSKAQQATIQTQQSAIEAEQLRLEKAAATTLRQEAIIAEQEKRIEGERGRYEALAQQSSAQQKLIDKQKQLMEQERQKYERLTQSVRERETALKEQAKQIEARATVLTEQDEKIKRQEMILAEQTETIAAQRNFLYALSGVIMMAIILVIVVFRNNRAKQRANAKLLKQTQLIEDTAEALAYTNEKLQLANVQAEAATRAKSRFLANMSHELRTPLNAILGFSQMLSTDASASEKAQQKLKIINRSGEHLLQLINDILDLSKIEAGYIELEPANFDLGALTRNVIDMMRVRAESKGLQLTLDQSSNFPRFIHGDAAKLRQILINLLSNAVKFTDVGGISLRLNVVNDYPESITLKGEVEDTGYGISREDIDRIFLPFEQQRDSDSQKGTGLGLAITRQFVELMGGAISAESTPGKGSLFRFTVQVQPTKGEVESSELIQVHQVIGLEPNQEAWRILIVEDDPESQLLLQILLEEIGFSIHIAENGKEAVMEFQTWQPHFIWMDRRMPVMDGVEATRKIRKLAGGDDVKIVALTASAFKEQEDEVMKAGADDFVRKPYRLEEIFDCMARQLGVRYLYKQEEEKAEAPQAVTRITPEMLAELPDDLIAELQSAVRAHDMEQTNAVLDRISCTDPDLINALRRLVEDMDFRTLKHLLGLTK